MGGQEPQSRSIAVVLRSTLGDQTEENMDKKFVGEYLQSCAELVNESGIIDPALTAVKLIKQSSLDGGKIIFAGNGASASIASHAALDFTKQAKITSTSFNEPALITAFANDYGYENWLQNALAFYMGPHDVVVLISSSGTSPNIVNAANFVKSRRNTLITFTGFENDNPCNSVASVGFWVNSRAYNMIEGVHQMWLMMICDMIIGKTEYSVK